MNFAETAGTNSGNIALNAIGSLSPNLVNAVYPMEAITKLHYAKHIHGATHDWIDLVDGAVRGPYHRLHHGHHLIEDGIRVISSPKLKYGEFLHHLGLDSLTKQGIHNPFIPNSFSKFLCCAGMNERFVSELCTVNVPKILGGSLSLICSGVDVWMAFSDTIPHTLAASGLRFLFGAAELGFGLFPPNALMLAAAASEFSVSAITLYRAVTDPILPFVGVPGSVFFPALGQSVALAGLIGACTGILTGSSFAETSKIVTSSSLAAAAGTFTGYAVNALAAPFAGALTFLVAKKALDAMFSEKKIGSHYPSHDWHVENSIQAAGSLDFMNSLDYRSSLDSPSAMNYRNVFEPQVLPIMQLPKEPIGMLKDGNLYIDGKGVRDAFRY